MIMFNCTQKQTAIFFCIIMVVCILVFAPEVLCVEYSSSSPGEQVVEIYNPAGIAKGTYVDADLKKIVSLTGQGRPPLLGEFPKVKVEQITITKDVFAEVNDLFYKRGWTDGLPIVPPTEELVKDMLRFSELSPDYVVSQVGPKWGDATVEKIAVNAVMAGCRPEYLPVLIAGVKAMEQESFKIGTTSTTTSNCTPLFIVSGPITEQLGISSSDGLGRGWRANASIGRALHLIINNIGGNKPGVNDMSTLGHPGDFANCIAEIGEINPWGYTHEELGYSKDANVVIALTMECFAPILSGSVVEDFLDQTVIPRITSGFAWG